MRRWRGHSPGCGGSCCAPGTEPSSGRRSRTGSWLARNTSRMISGRPWSGSWPRQEGGMSSVPIRLDGAQRILLVKPSALGDVIHTLPVAATLRRRYPNICLDWLVEEEAADLVRGHPALSGVVVSGRRRWLRQFRNPVQIPRTLGEVGRFAVDLRRRRYDAVLDLQGLFKSALYVLATGASIRVGFAEGREGAPRVLTHRVVAPPQPGHAVERYLALAAAVDATEPVREFHIALGPEDLAAARSRFAAIPRPRVVLHPA